MSVDIHKCPLCRSMFTEEALASDGFLAKVEYNLSAIVSLNWAHAEMERGETATGVVNGGSREGTEDIQGYIKPEYVWPVQPTIYQSRIVGFEFLIRNPHFYPPLPSPSLEGRVTTVEDRQVLGIQNRAQLMKKNPQ
jgi:hypothetical protein